MYTLPTSHYMRRSLLMRRENNPTTPVAPPMDHTKRVRQELRGVGVSRLGMLKFESRYLPQVIHPDEHIGGVVYGLHGQGSAMLIATDKRVIFLDKKPLFVNEDEVTYNVVSGVSFSHAGPASTVVLHTRIRDFPIETLNQRCAVRFVEYIEARCLEHDEAFEEDRK